MSNMTLKQWRETLRWPWKKRAVFQPAEHHRFVMESLMVVATVLAGIATAYGAYYARQQAEAARLTITAADRNKAFGELVVSFENLCAEGLLSSPLNSDLIRALESEKKWVQVEAATLEVGIARELPEFRRAARFYRIWVDATDQEFFSYTSQAISQQFVFFTKPSEAITRDGTEKDWIRKHDQTINVCANGVDALIRWFKTGERFDIKEIADQRPLWRLKSSGL
ncbi:hypothetical protein LAC81_02055 [Ensifer adhaerens]|uniref:hypothetical protein n=1 Tax=Ensifer adhaerens TaxID=106592 RepID=UPI001CBB488F|nr:hypothetical protein [Ensifer adhaerens]MBZ7920570.1 hypothetical protein [Ensifer adhaerens]UAX93045.1 hypothetical protein LAC78_02050 [Ensifer adhaerens]UAY00681.1 hypothetical protein LAC80_02055 [Ensifer adhaerens]UAY08062.1 hypothetical protein LAC81_02055 [Ensifer adhaerens]